nr:glycosyltransferase family 4 protein [Fredinandcohnia onubensis]
MKILWLTNIPSPYRVNFFNELGKYCDLTVLFEKGESSERDKSWRNYKFTFFKGVFLKGIGVGVDKAVSLEVIKYLKKGKYDHIVVSNFSTPTGIIAIEYMRLNKMVYSLESDGGFLKNNNRVKEQLKKHIIKGAELYFSTAKMHDEYYIKYGAEPDKILRYPFTSLYKSDILMKPLEKSEKNHLRNKLGIKEDKVVLSVGQFIHRKGFDILVKASKDLNDNVGIYIVGGDPTEEYIQLRRRLKLNNVHFIGFKNGAELREFYKAADLFVLPTREDIWGLVINEAMAYGLPVITTDKCIAGLELVNDSENGFIVPINNSSSLATQIIEVLKDQKVVDEMSKSSLEKIQKYTIENMATVHINILNSILNKDREKC